MVVRDVSVDQDESECWISALSLKLICPYTHIENLVLAHTDTRTHKYKHKHTHKQSYPQQQAQFSSSH